MARHQRGYIREKFGAFHVVYYVTDIVDGKPARKQRSHRLCEKNRATGHGSASSKAVRELCEDFMRKINADTPAQDQKPMGVTEFWDKTYLPFIESTLRPSTVWGYKQLFEQHLRKHFGQLSLRDYRTGMATIFLTELAKTYRPRTLQHIKFLASGLFAHAVAIDKAETNPWRDAKWLGKTKENSETESYTLEEIENVISALVDHVECQLIMALGFFLGLRKGEIAALEWSDIDDNWVHVRRAIGRGVVGVPKTKKSVRSLPLITPVRVPLVLWKNKSNGQKGWVFPNGHNKPMNLDVVANKIIKPAIEKNNIPWKGYHACRRGLGTTLRELTGNSNAAREVLGHTTARTTEAHYELAMPEEALRGMKLLEAKALNK